jgi:diphthamide synthase (EF-2-diphthine--ammonia ligase)
MPQATIGIAGESGELEAFVMSASLLSAKGLAAA